MDVSISSILRTIKTNIKYMQPIFEAIANSFDANANYIEIKFYAQPSLFSPNIIDAIEIIDNGEGFTESNINSFKTYMSELKLEKGGKGIGRFTWLKVFKNVKIDSTTLNTNVSIKFSSDFDASKDILITEKKNDSCSTKILFKDLIKGDNTIDLENAKKEILEYFMLKFIDFKDKNFNFVILLRNEEKTVKIDLNDVTDLNTEDFTVRDEINNTDVEFKLKYIFVESPNSHDNSECFLCGDGRIVEKYNLSKLFSSLPEYKSIKVLVYSEYFDNRINGERTMFTFNKNENNPSEQNPIPFSKISKEIANKLDAIILKEFPNIIYENKEVIEQCCQEKPFLSKYIYSDTSIIKRKQDILDSAQSKFENDKKNVTNKFVKILKSKEVDVDEMTKEFQKLNELSNRELAQYFLFRQTIIDSLKKLNDNDEKIEKYLHNLFYNMGDFSSDKYSLDDKYKNCIWLLDDKFMSYINCCSDKKISTIKKEIMRDIEAPNDGIEPDLTIFYSNHDIVVIEFKAIGASVDNKMNAYTEINRNISVIAKNFDNINNIYGYVITKFNEKFIDYISEQPGIKTLFSTSKDPVYYLYNGNITDRNNQKKNTYIYFMSTENIYTDANSRNKIFVDIIKNK